MKLFYKHLLKFIKEFVFEVRSVSSRTPQRIPPKVPSEIPTISPTQILQKFLLFSLATSCMIHKFSPDIATDYF